MVLFVLGLFGMLIINTRSLTSYLQENVLVILYFDNQISEVELVEKTDRINSLDYVKEATYITGQEAAFKYKEVLGKDFVEILGSNPIPASIEVTLGMLSLDRGLENVVEELKQTEGVSSVDFQQDLVDRIENVKRIAGLMLIALAMVLIIVSLVLINSTIRLDVYSKRFMVKSMQLVGASEGFIIRPFVRKALSLTVISAVLAFVLVFICNKLATSWVESEFFEVQHIFEADITIYSVLFACIMVLGLGIVLPSTYFATKKYLRLRIDDLY